MSIQEGDQVRWALDKRDSPHAPVRKSEYFRVEKVYSNGRCDLIDVHGGELFNIPITHLQPINAKAAPKHSG